MTAQTQPASTGDDLTEAQVRERYARLDTEYTRLNNLYMRLLQGQVQHDREVREAAMYAARSEVSVLTRAAVQEAVAEMGPDRLMYRVRNLPDRPTPGQVQELRQAAAVEAERWENVRKPDVLALAQEAAVHLRRQDPEALAGWVARGGRPEDWGPGMTPPPADAHL